MNNTEASSTTKTQRRSTSAARASGPRTPAGKRRSRRNSLKTGLFARTIFLDHESREEYEALEQSLCSEFQPAGASELEDVKYLATLYWRRRRAARAENAEMMNVIRLKDYDWILAKQQELWKKSREGESAGGLLLPSSNPFILSYAIGTLMLLREHLDTFGFQPQKDPWLIRKLYGLDHDGAAPFGLFQIYQTLSVLSAKGAEGTEESDDSKEALKKSMLEIFDSEIDRLRALKVSLVEVETERSEYGNVAASIPPAQMMDRIMRVESHISREIDRTLNRLERSWRRRAGQPDPPRLIVQMEESK